MATVQRFEDLLAWQKAREMTRDVYKVFRACRDGGFTDQIQRASVSVMSNIAEGFESGTPVGKQSFLRGRHAIRRKTQLYVAHDVGYINAETFIYLKCKAEECSKLLSSFIKGVKSSPHSGLQRKRGLTKDKLDAADFMRDTRKELFKIHPHLYNPDGTVKS